MEPIQVFVLALPLAAVATVVFVFALGAPRTAGRARLGLVLCAVACAAIVMEYALTGAGRLGLALLAVTAGLAHHAAFSIVPIPASLRGQRRRLAWTGAIAGGLWALIAWGWTGWLPLGLAWLATAATIGTWVVGRVLARRPATVLREGRPVPCVRFACPRCGVRADWAEGGYPCPDCGLFVHADWLRSEEGEDRTGLATEVDDHRPGVSVVLDCPECGRRAARPWGRTLCVGCGTPLRLSWNVHVQPAEPAQAS